MTREQRIALDHPCLLATETLHERFRYVGTWRNGLYSVVLTVNAGYE